MSQDKGSFQILIDAANDLNALVNGEVATYYCGLAGNYKLIFKSCQILENPDPTSANTFPLEIYSPSFKSTWSNVRYPTFLYTMDTSHKFNGNFDMTYFANLQYNIQIQLRDATTHNALPNLKYAILNFDFERL